MNRRRYRIEYGVTAQNDLDALPDKIRKQVLRKVERLESGLHGDIKRLRHADGCLSIANGQLSHLV